jgi:hypothetical protein
VARAAELAQWAWANLVNRADAWGAYTPRERRGQEYTKKDGTRAKVSISNTAKGALTLNVLARHFRGQRVEHLVGLHTTSPENTSRWAGVDIDQHGDSGSAPAANLTAALAWHNRLCRLGFQPLLTDSNGAGGYHLLTLFSKPVKTPLVYSLLHWLIADHAKHGLPHRPETFPKQAYLKPGGYGNWLRLPGRHHSREHWSRVWDGTHWLDGVQAVAFILSLRGDDPALIPAEALAIQPRVTAAVARPTAPSSVPVAGDLDRRIGSYINKQPAGLGEGQHRDDYGYTLACFLVRDLNLSDADALPWMEAWDARNAVSKGLVRLRELLKTARAYGQRAYGSGLSRRGPIRPQVSKQRGHRLRYIRFVVEG